MAVTSRDVLPSPPKQSPQSLAPLWDHDLVRRRLRPLRFRVAEEADLPFCERMHERNEAFGVPANHRPVHAAALREGRMLTLIAEDEGVPVGCCSLQWNQERVAWLCYGLVDPDRHRTGVGTTMFIARLALLPLSRGDLTIGITAIDTSLPFYRRFGFRSLGQFPANDGNRYYCAVLEGVSPPMIEACRAMLVMAGAVVPEVAGRIPIGPAPTNGVQSPAMPPWMLLLLGLAGFVMWLFVYAYLVR